MKKYTNIFIIVLLLVSFCIFDTLRKLTIPVLRVIDASTVQVDLNRNGILDNGETICIPEVSVLSSNLSNNQTSLTDKLKISVEDGIKFGYLSDNFADNELTDKYVKLSYTGLKNKDCTIADIKINNNSYREKLILSGFGIVENELNEKFYKNLDKAKNLDLVILNHKSNKYHKLGCEYGLIASDVIIIPFSQLQSDSIPCKFCHLNSEGEKKQKVIIYPQVITSGNLKMYITDSTTKLKPDDKCESLVCKDILNSIKNSQTSIDIALYGWDSIPAIYDALKQAKARGIKIRVVYDISDINYYPKTNEVIALADSVKSDSKKGLMHNKFIIIDNNEIYTGSMNFSKTGLSGFNTNNIFQIKSKDITDVYKKEFEQMLFGNFKTQKTEYQSRTYLLGDTKLTPLFSPQGKIINKKIIPLIENAKSYIYLPIFIITHDSLSKALVNAKTRGVDVKIIVDATNTNSIKSKIKYLRDSGIPVKTENYAGKLHSKAIIIDDRYIVSGSMNFTNSGENKNDENVLIIENYKLANFYKKFFEYYWNKIPEKYLKYNPSPEGKSSVGSCFDGIDNNYDGNIDLKDKHCSNN